MALLSQGRAIADAFVTVADDAPVPPDVPAIVPLARLRAEPGLPDRRTAPLGVLVPAATPPAALADLLPAVALIAVAFAKFRDGRGFTLARTLRERHAYAGEVRAAGHVLPDQYRFLIRCGFDTVEIPDGADPAVWVAALGRFHLAYQTAVNDAPLHGRRRLAG